MAWFESESCEFRSDRGIADLVALLRSYVVRSTLFWRRRHSAAPVVFTGSVTDDGFELIPVALLVKRPAVVMSGVFVDVQGGTIIKVRVAPNFTPVRPWFWIAMISVIGGVFVKFMNLPFFAVIVAVAALICYIFMCKIVYNVEKSLVRSNFFQIIGH